MTVSGNSAYDADREGWRELKRSSLATPREERYGEDVPSDAELEDDKE